MKKDFRVFVDDILDSIDKIENSTKDIDFDTFVGNYEKIDTVAYNVIIIGEAVNKIPTSVQRKYPEIPWRILNDIRSKHIHEYRTVKPDKLWKMAKLSLPKLKPMLKELLENETQEQKHACRDKT
jgi:uncharacterized protein with HEPN domain